MTVYGGVQGDLNQQSYYGFAQENKFVSPTLNIVPTHNQFDAVPFTELIEPFGRPQGLKPIEVCIFLITIAVYRSSPHYCE